MNVPASSIRCRRLPALLALVLLGAVLSWNSPTARGQLSAAAAKASPKPIAAKEPAGELAALNTLDEGMRAAWLKLPNIAFRKALLVSAPAEGFGIYTPRENNVFDGKTPLLFYAEPAGYGWRDKGDMHEIDLALDIALKSPKGEQVFEQKDFQAIKLASHAWNRELMLNLRLSLTGAPAGKYIAVVTVRDNATSKSGSFETPFEIKE